MSDFKMPDLSNIMQAAQKMQGDVTKLQEELLKRTCEASAGGGMITAEVNGQFEVVAIRIDPEVVSADDVEMLQDLVVAAVNQAVAKVREMTQSEMAKLTSGLGVPGMPNLF